MIKKNNITATPIEEQPGGPAVTCPLDYQRAEHLLDNTPITIRPICSADKKELLAFHSRLSQDSVFLRYHYSKSQLTDFDLKIFCDIDYINDLGLVAETEREGRPEIIGVGRYSRLPGDHSAEVAFVVQDQDQHKGVGTLLLKHLAILAWERGIFSFCGEVLRENGKMLSIFRKSDRGMKQEIDSSSTCNITISVAQAMQSAV